MVEEALKQLAAAPGEAKAGEKLRKLKDEVELYRQAGRNYTTGNFRGNQTGKLGVDLAESSQRLRGQNQIVATANRFVQGRNCVDIGGVWVDEKYEEKTKTVAVRAQSPAYFKILEKHQEMKDVFSLGNYLVWIAPSGTALVVDANAGQEELSDAEIGTLFASAK